MRQLGAPAGRRGEAGRTCTSTCRLVRAPGARAGDAGLPLRRRPRHRGGAAARGGQDVSTGLACSPTSSPRSAPTAFRSYRQAKALARAGVPINRTTLGDLFHTAADVLVTLGRATSPTGARGAPGPSRRDAHPRARRGARPGAATSGRFGRRSSSPTSTARRRSGETPARVLERHEGLPPRRRVQRLQRRHVARRAHPRRLLGARPPQILRRARHRSRGPRACSTSSSTSTGSSTPP